MVIVKRVVVCGFITFCLTARPDGAWAQEVKSRNRGITWDMPAGRRAAVEAPAPQGALQPQPCDGANYATNAFNGNISMGGPLVAIAWTPPAAVTISRIEVFTGNSSAPVALAVWSDDGASINSKPSANLGNTPYFALSTAIAWQGSDLLSPVSLNAGTKYWIVFDPSGGEQAPVQNGTPQEHWASYTGTITAVSPSDWFGPFSFPDHAWKFRVFCVLPPIDVYAAKFVCGSFLPKASSDHTEWPLKPGNYLTVINVHNPNMNAMGFRKKAVLLYRSDKPAGPEEPMPPGKLFDVSLRADWGLQIDCPDIRSKLLAGIAPAAPTLIEGWVVFEVAGTRDRAEPRPIDVTAVYTSHGWDHNAKTPAYVGFAQDVESVLPKRVTPH